MARFRATIEGNRGMASRLGTPASGITANINGWDSGIRVIAFVDEETGKDRFLVAVTGGSKDPSYKEVIYDD